MIVISEAQMHTFVRDRIDRFEDRMVAWLASEFPSDYGPDKVAAARALIRSALDRGAANRIENEGPLAGLVALMAEFGENFERTPDGSWGRAVLAHETLPDELKIETIVRRFEARTEGRKVVRVAATPAE